MALLEHFTQVDDPVQADCIWVHDPSAMASCPKEKPIFFFLRQFHLEHPVPFRLVDRINQIPIRLCIAISASVQAQWHQQITHPIVTIPNGVDTHRFCPAPCDRKPQIAFVGRLDWDKGIDFLIKQWSSNLPRLVIAGQNFSDKFFGKAVVKAAAENPNVELLGVLPQDQVIQLFRESLLTVLPSRREPFGRVIIESMACGTPVVASSVGGIPEIVPPEFLFQPLNPDSFRQVLTRYLNWPQQSPDLGHQLRQHVIDQFEIGEIANQIKTAIAALI